MERKRLQRPWGQVGQTGKAGSQLAVAQRVQSGPLKQEASGGRLNAVLQNLGPSGPSACQMPSVLQVSLRAGS